jgi:hypothetical protein
MALIYVVKRALKRNQRITPKMFSRIKKSEKTMQLIDDLVNEGWDCPWYELYKKAALEIKNDVFSLVMERAKETKVLDGFYYAFDENHSEIACEKGLLLAKTFQDFGRIAEIAKLQKNREKAISGALAVARSSKECSNIIGNLLKKDLKRAENFVEQSIEKGVSLAKCLCDDVAELRCTARWYGNPALKKKLERDLVLAKCLIKSRLVFEHKRQLKAQVDFCERRGDESLRALESLLTSILEFDRYKHLCAMVPKGQKRLS